jgi:predicted solute-binding protein
VKKILRISPRFVQATSEDYRHQIQGQNGRMPIGDRALEQRKTSTFIYDLGKPGKIIQD